MGTTSVRRNLFHHNLSRRPVSAAPPTGSRQSSGSNGVSGLSSRMLHSSSESSTASLTSGPVDNGDIVVRDKNGGYKLDIPILTLVVDRDGDEMDGVDEGRNTGGTVAASANSTAQTEISGEKEKIEAGLAELMYRSRNRQMSNEPAEILNLIQQSLQSKVAALEEDNWMYESEVDS